MPLTSLPVCGSVIARQIFFSADITSRPICRGRRWERRSRSSRIRTAGQQGDGRVKTRRRIRKSSRWTRAKKKRSWKRMNLKSHLFITKVKDGR